MTAPKYIKGPRIKNTIKVPTDYLVEETYDEAMIRIMDYCEDEGLNFDHEMGKYLAGI